MSQMLLAAVQKRDINQIKTLLRAGANPSFRNQADGKTPLHLAAFAGHADICSLLVEAGADLLSKDGQGFTPVQVAANAGRMAVFFLLSKKAPLKPS